MGYSNTIVQEYVFLLFFALFYTFNDWKGL